MIEFWVNYFFYKCLIFVFFSPIFLLFAFLPTPEKPGLFKIGYSILAVVMIVVFFSIPWLAYRAADRRVNDNELFHQALVGAFSDARFYLSFLPIVGSLFQYRSKTDSSFEDSKPIE